jgi:hypothetical protein
MAAAGWGRRPRGAGARGALAFARVGILERLGNASRGSRRVSYGHLPFVPSPPNPRLHPTPTPAAVF